MSSPRHTRIAPTPSGFLHRGNAFSFLEAARWAKETNGSLLLRIDDLDGDRKRPEYIADIFESLAWLGIHCDRGPVSPDDFEAHWSQRHRLPLYEAALERLVKTGLVYACSCSRKELSSLEGRCGCREKKNMLTLGDVAWRLYVADDVQIDFNDERLGDVRIGLAGALGDFVVRRRDGIPAYQLTSLVDDVHFGINAVVRGEDLLHSTAAQLYLAQVLNMHEFERTIFLHHELIVGDDGQKLSKSAGAESLKELRNMNRG